jgi:hypothetical protein
MITNVTGMLSDMIKERNAIAETLQGDMKGEIEGIPIVCKCGGGRMEF